MGAPPLTAPPVLPTPSPSLRLADPDHRDELGDSPHAEVFGSIGEGVPSGPVSASNSVSPRPRRPPPTRVRQALHQAIPKAAYHSSCPNNEELTVASEGGLLRGRLTGLMNAESTFSVNMGDVEDTNASFAFGDGVPVSPWLARRSRSRSMPIVSRNDQSQDWPPPKNFFEAFGGFYKQFVQGTKCTGPDALAGNERLVEIDLSAEFPPERRQAQVDPHLPQPAKEFSSLHPQVPLPSAVTHSLQVHL